MLTNEMRDDVGFFIGVWRCSDVIETTSSSVAYGASFRFSDLFLILARAWQ